MASASQTCIAQPSSVSPDDFDGRVTPAREACDAGAPCASAIVKVMPAAASSVRTWAVGLSVTCVDDSVAVAPVAEVEAGFTELAALLASVCPDADCDSASSRLARLLLATAVTDMFDTF
ncbi:hypothetical protein [Caballeronia sp. SBC1]|uniref:hypothetical protein n=1 Tax=Caballeronia sp. SBC1 TaxID=2705548 RepID=UPI0013ED12AB|nr:hypothetical protein [Caballeronia sp. SBC1]